MLGSVDPKALFKNPKIQSRYGNKHPFDKTKGEYSANNKNKQTTTEKCQHQQPQLAYSYPAVIGRKLMINGESDTGSDCEIMKQLFSYGK